MLSNLFFQTLLFRYNALCRGEELRPASYTAKLKCYMKHNEDPFYRLNPIKEEIAHLEPKISVYHDVMSPEETEAIQITALPFVSLFKKVHFCKYQGTLYLSDFSPFFPTNITVF